MNNGAQCANLNRVRWGSDLNSKISHMKIAARGLGAMPSAVKCWIEVQVFHGDPFSKKIFSSEWLAAKVDFFVWAYPIIVLSVILLIGKDARENFLKYVRGAHIISFSLPNSDLHSWVLSPGGSVCKMVCVRRCAPFSTLSILHGPLINGWWYSKLKSADNFF